jgi:hypothetical protein
MLLYIQSRGKSDAHSKFSIKIGRSRVIENFSKKFEKPFDK